MSGAEIKERIKAEGIKIWQVAKEFGMNDGNFSRKLRGNFSNEDTQKVLSIIEKLKNR